MAADYNDERILENPRMCCASNASHQALLTPSPAERLALATTSVRNSTVLVVDDDPDCLDITEHHLRRAGYTVITAEDGEEAMHQLENLIPHLILLDCEMPKLNGFEVCERLKATPHLADSPVIFLTAHSDPGHVTRGFSVGGVDFVRKPVVVAELLARVRTHIELALVRQSHQNRARMYEEITTQQSERLNEVRHGQEILLSRVEEFPELKLGVRFVPAHIAGGDFYEISRLGEREYGLLVADVSGHDLSVPFITGALKALTATFINEAISTQETMIQLNAVLSRFLSDSRYVTSCFVKYWRDSEEIEITSAGHAPALFQSSSGIIESINITGDVLGMYDNVRFETHHLSVKPGDRLFLYSDGIVEGYLDDEGRRGRALYGQQRLMHRLLESSAETVKKAVYGAVESLLDECSGEIGDDVVLLGIEF